MLQTQEIRDFYNRVIGRVVTDTVTGLQTARNFYNVILGTYDPKLNVTRDFYGRIISKGNILSSLIWEDEKKKNEKRK